ncbi:PREDICTED: melanocyte-stimulating hormone receptor-like [Branchiostoma belcheri]|uniref:Melanocyte-stimulating hormone receptor-like n=1 Tax=Branchiostoma belcheri TaxID=7741 RepID=A0A6P4ZK38_BRABE|nr:PREDICTED: melanocyte-stimulating hormone receptor-like [Branchiostoma belcheri]XP_019629996.1 PREDICTED: melanocyte-stimulating hormone receptor-like [Branchiostoma belcheri]
MEGNISDTITTFTLPNGTGPCLEWFAGNGLGEILTYETVKMTCAGSRWGPFDFPGREVLTITTSVIGNLLNSLVVFAVAKLHQHTPLYYLIANLAVTDIMTNVVGNVMLEITDIVAYRQYVLLLVTVLHFPVILSLTGLVLLSMDRYVSVEHAIFYHATVGGEHVLGAVAGAWVSAALLCFSPMMGWNCDSMDTAENRLCFLGAVEGSYILFMTVLCTAGVAVVVFTNARVFLALRRRLAVVEGGEQRENGRVHMNQHQIVLAQKKARSVLVIIAVFLLAWLLFLSWQVRILVTIYNGWENNPKMNVHFGVVFVVVVWLVPIVNPLVYAFRLPTLRSVVWNSFRNGWARLWRCLNPPQQVHPANMDMAVIAQ